MKRTWYSLAVLLIILSAFAVGCDKNDETKYEKISYTPGDEIDYDYSDSTSFEKALNDGIDVTGKIVRFEVVKYEPNSGIGINCWAGEHLNFISEHELDVNAGDIVIGQVTEKPSKVLGSWKIPYLSLFILTKLIWLHLRIIFLQIMII